VGGQLSAPSAACASGKRHVWLQVQDLESRNGACLPMACKAERWLSRSWLRPAGFGLGGRHHRSLANKRLPWSTFKVRSRRAPCSGSRQCPVLGQTFVRTTGVRVPSSPNESARLVWCGWPATGCGRGCPLSLQGLQGPPNGTLVPLSRSAPSHQTPMRPIVHCVQNRRRANAPGLLRRHLGHHRRADAAITPEACRPSPWEWQESFAYHQLRHQAFELAFDSANKLLNSLP